MSLRFRFAPLVGLVLALAGCGGGIVPPTREVGAAPPHRTTSYVEPELPVTRGMPAVPLLPQPVTPVAGAVSAATAGVVAGPALGALPIDEAGAARALAAFRASCPSLVRRTDGSGLTRGADWQPACTAAAGMERGGARAFLQRWFEAAQVGDGRAFATGYFVPEIAGSRERRPGYDVPVYGRPSDLVDVDLGLFSDELRGRRIRGRVQGSTFVPYYERREIEGGAIARTAPVIAWAADTVDVFFLQVQGSGLLRLPDGQVLRIGYDSQNGRAYTGIGALMRDRGLVQPGQASMQGIAAWLRAHPEQGRALMDENKSFVFFRLLDGPPLGALGVPVAGATSVAADPRFVPLGAPVFLSMDRTDAGGLWVAQDTGGAIRGSNRFDTFWGAGAQARSIAGGMSAHGTAFVLLPIGTVARLQGAWLQGAGLQGQGAPGGGGAVPQR